MTWMQQWLDCLFLHFPVPAAAVQRHVPPRLEVETFAGSAWISYVLFRLNLRPAWLPRVPGFSSLIELNIRTYVRHRGQSGIYFLRMLADNRLAIAAARLLTPLPYEHARMAYSAGHANCRPTSRGRESLSPEDLPHGEMIADKDSRPPGLAVQFRRPARYDSLKPGTLDDWLLERYRLFLGGRSASILAADAEHPPWQAALLSPAVSENSLAADFGLDRGSQPAAAHYSPGVAARFHAFRIVAAQRIDPCRRREGLPAAAISHRVQPSRGE